MIRTAIKICKNDAMKDFIAMNAAIIYKAAAIMPPAFAIASLTFIKIF